MLALIFACIAGLIAFAFPGTSVPRILGAGAVTGILAFAAVLLWERWWLSRTDSTNVPAVAVGGHPFGQLDDRLTQPATPSLRVGSTLEADNQCLRLRVFNDSIVRCQPRVAVTAVTDDQGKALLPPAQAPLELAWTHQPEGQRASLAKADVEGDTVAVIWSRPIPALQDANLYLYGMHHRPFLSHASSFARRPVIARLVVSCPEFPSMERLECEVTLYQERGAPLGFSSTVRTTSNARPDEIKTQWTSDDGPVLAASRRVLARQKYAGANDVAAELGRGTDDLPTVMRSMKLLIDSDFLGGKVLTGDATIQDVMATSVTEKGLERLGQWPKGNR